LYSIFSSFVSVCYKIILYCIYLSKRNSNRIFGNYKFISSIHKPSFKSQSQKEEKKLIKQNFPIFDENNHDLIYGLTLENYENMTKNKRLIEILELRAN